MTIETESELKVTWSQNLTDFRLLLKSGREVECHKFILAENSPFFKAMFNQDCLESKTNQMKIDHFDDETVFSFLQYIYTPVKDAETMELIRAYVGQSYYIYKRSFETSKLTLDLLKMGHMYRVEDMQLDCTEYQKGNIRDENVMAVWMVAEGCDNKILCSTAINHLVERPDGKKLVDVPEFTKAFRSSEKPLTDLLAAMSMKNLHLRDELKDSTLPKPILIRVIQEAGGRAGGRRGGNSESFAVDASYSLNSLAKMVQKRFSLHYVPHLQGAEVGKKLDPTSTFEENEINPEEGSSYTLYIVR